MDPYRNYHWPSQEPKLEVPTIRPIFQGYVMPISPQNMANNPVKNQ